jgi:hypothetical protein
MEELSNPPPGYASRRSTYQHIGILARGGKNPVSILNVSLRAFNGFSGPSRQTDPSPVSPCHTRTYNHMAGRGDCRSLRNCLPRVKNSPRLVLLSLLGVCAWFGLGSGCAKYAATSNRLYEGEADNSPVKILSADEQGRVQKAMKRVAADHDQVRQPARRTFGVRWSDVSNAVYYAVAEVEMAIVSTTEHDWGWEFQLLTIEDSPGTLVVRRTNDERVYEATATVGGVVDQPARAQALIKELHKQMLAFARKPSLATD